MDLAAPAATDKTAAAVLHPWQRELLERLQHPEPEQQQMSTVSCDGSGAADAQETHNSTGNSKNDDRSSCSSSSNSNHSSASGVMRVSFGGQPPVSASLLAAVRVMTLQVRMHLPTKQQQKHVNPR